MTTLIFFALTIFVGGVSAFNTGPPLSACGTLIPNHPTSTGNKDPVPWAISVDPVSAMYAPGDTITVELAIAAPSNDFRGFMMQARRTSGNMDEAIGTFGAAPAGTQLLTCGNAGSTWAHSNNERKSSVEIMWTAPASNEGNIAFRATVVVQNSGGTSTFYTNLMSQELTYNGPTEAPTTAGPTEAPTTAGPTDAPTTADTGVDERIDGSGTGMCPVVSNGTVGSCVEECSSDDNCTTPGQMCCSNGCGQVCTDSVLGATESSTTAAADVVRASLLVTTVTLLIIATFGRLL